MGTFKVLLLFSCGLSTGVWLMSVDMNGYRWVMLGVLAFGLIGACIDAHESWIA
jgi:hypothetical protein